MFIFLIVIIVIFSLCGLLLLFYHPLSLLWEKITFKKKVYKTLYKIAKNYDLYLLNKVAIKVGNKIIHFDHLLFGDKYIYCVGRNYYSYGIDGKMSDPSWFSYNHRGKNKIINNPMKLHRERVNYFASLITSSKELFVACVIVNNSCLLRNVIDGEDKYSKVINLKNFEKLVKNYERDNSVSEIDPQLLSRLVLDIYKKGVVH